MKEFITAIKPLFPVTFNLDKFVQLSFASNAELFTMLVQIAVYLVAGIVLGVVLGLIGLLPILGLVCGVIGSLFGLYSLAGIVLSVLKFAKVID